MAPPPFFSRFYWQVSLTLLGILLLVGAVYVGISFKTANHYFEERQQRLNADVAEHLLDEVTPFQGDTINQEALGQIMHSMMAVNPGIEVYLLDPEGEILSYVAPHKKILLNRVDLGPVRTFLSHQGETYIRGEDPRHPGQQKVFSAAPVYEAEQLKGYVYIILAGDAYQSATELLLGSHMLRLGGWSLAITLLVALLLGLGVLYLVTRYLSEIIRTVEGFRQGNLQARIPVRRRGELSQLALSFNEMADTIVADMEKLRTLERLRRELIGNVSHDLRTPLAVVQGYIETVLMKNEDLAATERARYLHLALSSSQRLEKLVGDLFELSKLEALQVEPKYEPFFISELVQDMLPRFQGLAEKQGLRLAATLPPNLPPVYADVAMIERVLQNLLENALKFTPEGGEVRVEVIPHDQQVEIKVSDTGIGIPESDLPFIFDRYYRSERRASKGHSSGLGLAISQKLLRLHQVSIEVGSRLGEGAQFSFALPAYRRDQPAG